MYLLSYYPAQCCWGEIQELGFCGLLKNAMYNRHAMHVGLNFSWKLGSAEERWAVVMDEWVTKDGYGIEVNQCH
jgi:hypothetical protein